jgi:omega-hydroxy-beta-dihydromenaquinone-9 sulfotransferase
MRLGPYLGLLAENGFRIHPFKWPMFGLGFGVSCVNSVLGCVQDLVFSRRIAATQIAEPPIFIIGHWRSGTTLIHELFTLDEAFGYPNNFDAFAPNHLLLSRPMLYPLIQLLLPGKRPMDAMSLSANSPQEDDFALVSLGAPTMYRDIAFPNRRFNRQPLENAAIQEKTKRAMQYFLKLMTMRYQRPLVLKSPPHTSRVKNLSEWFPGARFVHISRHPFQIMASTIRLWQALDETQGFQLPKYSEEQLRNYVFDQQRNMYEHYFAAAPAIRQENLIEIRFEDLIADPKTEMSRIYSRWNLAGFDDLAPKIDNYFADRKEVKPTSQTNDHVDRALIVERWSRYMERFGYSA